MARQIQWARVLAEGVVIVASIILAFGIQAWWEQLGEAQRREAILSGLASDFHAAARELDSLASVHQEALAGAGRLMRMTEDGSVDSTLGPQVDSLLSVIAWGGSFDPPVGTLQSLIATGSLDILGNEPLAQALTPWQARVVSLQRREEGLVDRISELLAVLAEAGVDGSDLAWHEFYPEVPWTLKHTNAWSVVGSPLIRTSISDLWFSYRSTTRRQERLREDLNEILRLLPPSA